MTLLLLTLSAGFSPSQSLVELARKEKERREKLKGKKSRVVTNADLRKLKIRPAVSVQKTITAEPETPKTSAPSSTETSPPPEPKEPEIKPDQKDEGLEKRWETAKENVALLTSRLNALWKQYHSAGSTVPRDYLQQQISLTHFQLQKALQEEDKLKRQVDETAAEKKK